jgi:CHASE2 domain-containing sensor protein/tRNA A-37 threonylcarbamoyl transferase component Bud32
MAEKHTSTLTKKYVSATNRQSNKITKMTATVLARSSKLIPSLGHLLAGMAVIGAAVLTFNTVEWAKLLENHTHSAFFRLRKELIPPDNIAILAIDEESISTPEGFYKSDPIKNAFFEPLQKFPFKRQAYAEVIEKLMQAGARSVALDIVFDAPSSYGVADDRKFQAVLQRYSGKVTLAAIYDESKEIREGQIRTTKLLEPNIMFRTKPASIGLANFPKEPDGKIHKLGADFTKSVNQEFHKDLKPFDEAVLAAANVNYPRLRGDRINFFTPGKFESFPFSHVIDPDNWNTYLEQGKVFKDKIVIIGATYKLGKDYFPVPVSEEMPGVEIHANAIATLMSGTAIAEGIPSIPLRALFVLSLVSVSATIVIRTKHGIYRLLSSFGVAIAWFFVSYGLFAYAQLILPTAIPVVAIVMIGFSYFGCEIVKEKIKKIELVDILKRNSSNRLAQEIISQQDDLKELLEQRQIEISGKILDGRYEIVKVLGSGGFSETYIAKDNKRPGNPRCVVKQLKPANNKSEQMQVARRLFNSEAQTLENLGTYNQIPQLLAYFEEEEEFYLVQEQIIGHPLSQELPTGKQIPENIVIEILRDLLQTLIFVHKNGVIHRDIKPSNIIRRNSDRKLVLIDFGAVKEAATQSVDSEEDSAFTIAIGTKGYAPTEQCFGRPQYNSDIYALGMIGIKALTGIAPHDIERDSYGELKWTDKVEVSSSLALIINQMVLDDFQKRYQSATVALKALNDLVGIQQDSDPTDREYPTNDSSMNTVSLEDSDTPTTPWVGIPEENSDSSKSIDDHRNQ